MTNHFKQASYYVAAALVSAGLALSLPSLLSVLSGNLIALWAFMEKEKLFLVAAETAVAIGFVCMFHLMRRILQDKRVAGNARKAGLVDAMPPRGFSLQKRRKRMQTMKDRQGAARDVMIIGSTGFSSLALPDGDLYGAVRNCREAKIMLLDPREHGAIARAQSIPDPEITPEAIREQVLKSVEAIKSLRSPRKPVRLKLYPDMPLLKLAIIGDYAYVRHYHTGLNVRAMPEFAFRNIQPHGGLYLPLCRYFLSRWQDPDMPEYDLDTDEIIYRDQLGYEVLREPFNGIAISHDERQRKEREPERSFFR